MATTATMSASDSKTKSNSTSKSNGSNSSDSTSNIESTIESIEQHIEKKSPSGVTTSINNWIKALSGNKDLKDIASDLEDLKEALSEKDGKKIVELMTSLGEKTTASAENAEGNDAKGVKKLGKALTSAAKTIGKWIQSKQGLEFISITRCLSTNYTLSKQKLITNEFLTVILPIF